MELTTNLEAEVKQLYVLYFESLFNADSEKYKSFLADDFKQIGTTLEEVWFSKNEAGNYLEKAVGPVAGMIEFRNREIRIEAVDRLIGIIEQADCYVKIDGIWAFYDKARVSSLLQKKVTDWKFVQQHISFPDSKTEEGQTVALEKIKAENIQLKEAVKRRTVELENTNRDLENTLEKLKSAQAQLIHSEKMASLGELTAGIAHEIQNPLNFVNNFSEVSAELVEEIEEERGKRQEERNETLVNEILGNIKENLQKINHHGKRADSIVKGMLEHSRTTKGEKTLTDINILANEFLRLSYHGVRATNNNFNAEFETNFDPNLPGVNIVPQDIGRVLQNIITNAFQAFECTDLRLQDPNFKPRVTVSTKNTGNKIEISIADNGPGIPEEIREKIFQPFFTTKPTGQGTGLGLSLSYDIVKAHGGEIVVNSVENGGSIFTVILPVA